jgi:two-component system cell cycle sensor histidine kinase/response regulator CckA
MTPPATHRVLVIDDTAGIHEDFRKLFQRPDAASDSVDAAAAALFDEVRTPTTALTEIVIESSFQGQDGAAKVRQALAEERPYSLAFVDMRMPPGWDGLETVQHLWQIDPRLQIVICTAHSDHSWQDVQDRLGPTDSLIILKKPFDYIEAHQLAQTLCRKWTLSRENESRLILLDEMVRARTLELRFAEQRFAQAFAANPHAQALIALDRFEILDVNLAFTRQFGIATADLTEVTPEKFGRGVDPHRWRLLLARVLQGEEIDDYAFVFERSPTDLRNLHCSARLINVAGRPCSIWLIRDVTDQLLVEQQLRQAQKMESVGQLAAGIAHDFNNLLTVIQAYAGFIHDTADDDQKASVVLIREAANRAAALTRQLLVFSRRQITNPVPIDLGVSFGDLRKMLSRLVPERIRLEWQVPETLPCVVADAGNLEQAVMNLAVNARDAIPHDGIITVAFHSVSLPPEADLRHPKARPGNYVVISVSDTGSGIAPEILARIWEPFFTTKESGKGTGLGLSTTQSIVEQHHGWIEVTSRLGVGTTFDLYIPVSAEIPSKAAAKMKTRHPFDAPGAIATRLLIVEDDAMVRSVAVAIAKKSGYQVTEATDGASAIAHWEKAGHRFDLVLTDVVMPNGINGIDLIYRLRRDRPDLKAIFVTGYSDELLRGSADDLGNIPILLKPYEQTTLLTLLQDTLDCSAPFPESTS